MGWEGLSRASCNGFWSILPGIVSHSQFYEKVKGTQMVSVGLASGPQVCTSSCRLGCNVPATHVPQAPSFTKFPGTGTVTAFFMYIFQKLKLY